jgi:hypothetical protein
VCGNTASPPTVAFKLPATDPIIAEPPNAGTEAKTPYAKTRTSLCDVFHLVKTFIEKNLRPFLEGFPVLHADLAEGDNKGYMPLDSRLPVQVEERELEASTDLLMPRNVSQ